MSQLLTVAKPRRNTELLLLVLALGMSAMANALVNLNLGRSFDNDFYTQIAILAVLSFGFHVVLRLRAKYADPVILPVVVALNGLGLAVIHRLDITSGDTAATRQWMWTSLAVVAAIAVVWFLRDHRILRRYTYISLVVSVVLLIFHWFLASQPETSTAPRSGFPLGPLPFSRAKLPRSLWQYSSQGTYLPIGI